MVQLYQTGVVTIASIDWFGFYFSFVEIERAMSPPDITIDVAIINSRSDCPAMTKKERNPPVQIATKLSVRDKYFI